MHQLIFIRHLALVALIFLITEPLAAQKPFYFFAIGDMPYHNPEDIEKFKMLTERINKERPAFTVHVGDIKNGSSDCSDAYNTMMLQMFNGFDAPLIYTPGDNEWTDCHRPAAGGYDQLERLEAIRRTFFRNNQSMGMKPMKFRSQSQVPGFEDYVENVIWRHRSVTFATVHVVGSNNNFKAAPESNEEFHKRDHANLHWLAEAFSSAKKNEDAAVVLVIHGAINYIPSETNGFSNIAEKLRAEVKEFAKPVLLVYGDHHRFQISKPLVDAEDNLIQNFTALMVFGDTEMNAVRVTVNPGSKDVFTFSEFILEYSDSDHQGK